MGKMKSFPEDSWEKGMAKLWLLEDDTKELMCGLFALTSVKN